MTGSASPLRRFAVSQLEHPLDGLRVDREDQGLVLREAARVGAAAFFVASRALRRERRVPGETPGPPGRPYAGYGSRERYIADRVTEHAHGSASDGSRVWWFIPNVLRDGERAPVVVYLHGFRASAPDLYWEHIHHLTAQGLIVVFPRINKGGAVGLLSDNDQSEMVRRAVDASVVALDEIDSLIDREQLYVFGHSLGGLIGACWSGSGGPAARGIVLAHPSVRMDSIPEVAQRFITAIDWRPLAASCAAPVIILGGDQDTLVPPEECVELAEALEAAPRCVVYIARSDDHGVPVLRTGHLATVRSDSRALRWVGQYLGGNEANDALQSRFYHAALDAMIDGELRPELDLGKWSDGTPLCPPTIEFDRTRPDRRPPGKRRRSAKEAR